MAYGDDPWTARLHERVAEVFERDDVAVFPVVSGTAANALGLSALCPPWGAVLCHETAHIVANEGGATSLFTSAVMRPLPRRRRRAGSRRPRVEAAFAATRWGDPHHSQPAVVSMTQPTDLGTVYPLDQVRAVADVARSRGVRVHLDGARIANAVVALGCSPADLTWRAGRRRALAGRDQERRTQHRRHRLLRPGVARPADLPPQAGRPRRLEDALPVGPARRLPHRRAVAAARRHGQRRRWRALVAGLARSASSRTTGPARTWRSSESSRP